MDFLEFINDFNLSYTTTLVKYEKLFTRRDYSIVNNEKGRIITFLLTEEEINKLLGINTKNKI